MSKKYILIVEVITLSMFLIGSKVLADDSPYPARFIKPSPITMAKLAKRSNEGVSVVEVSDYVYGNYQGKFESPPHADFNPQKALIISWKDFPFRFVFSHEASYCPWFELPSGAGTSMGFLKGKEGHGLMNQWGRKERNSFVDIIESGPERVWVRWTYFGVDPTAGYPSFRATEDFWAYPNGLILRRQTYRTLSNYAMEPIEMIGICPAGKLWPDVLQKGNKPEMRHALTVLDAFSPKRYDVYWNAVAGMRWIKGNKTRNGVKWWLVSDAPESGERREGSKWKELDDAAGVALVMPLTDGAPFCIIGDASGFQHDATRLKELTDLSNGGTDWGTIGWNHWPIGWLNSRQAKLGESGVDDKTLPIYPTNFSTAAIDLFALPPSVAEQGVYYSLMGVGNNKDMEAIRTVARKWLENGTPAIIKHEGVADLPAPIKPAAIAAHLDLKQKSAK